jgi:hypothetical protein
MAEKLLKAAGPGFRTKDKGRKSGLTLPPRVLLEGGWGG